MSRKKSKKKILKIKGVVFFIIIVIGIYFFIDIKYPLICIDAGHGGKDVGSIYQNERYEKNDNLDIALKVKKELRRKGFRVIMTRKNDKILSLEKRCQIANFFRAKVFVSIHRNSAKSGNGVEIWISPNDEEGKELAESIIKSFDNTKIQTNRGIKEGTMENKDEDYFVNKNTKMPSCLIELGFISDKRDNELLDANIDEYANYIAEGIEKSIRKK